MARCFAPPREHYCLAVTLLSAFQQISDDNDCDRPTLWHLPADERVLSSPTKSQVEWPWRWSWLCYWQFASQLRRRRPLEYSHSHYASCHLTSAFGCSRVLHLPVTSTEVVNAKFILHDGHALAYVYWGLTVLKYEYGWITTVKVDKCMACWVWEYLLWKSGNFSWK